MAKRAHITHWLGLAAAALIFAGVGVGVLLGAQRFIADARYVTHTNEVISTMNAFEARLRDAESAQRGYLLTSNVDYLAAYRSNHEQWLPLLDQLAALVSDNPVQQGHLRQLRGLLERRQVQIEQNLARHRHGGLAEVGASIDPKVIEVSSAMRGVTQAFIAHERTLLAQRDRSSQRSALVLRGLALLGIPLGLAVLAAVYRRLLQEVHRRSQAEHASEQANERLRESVERLQHHSAGLAQLNRYSSLLQTCLQVEEAIGLSTQLLAQLLPDSGGTLYRIRASCDYAEEVTHWGTHVVSSQPMLPPADCWALRRSQVHTCTAGDTGARCAHLGQSDSRATTACIPLTAQGTQLGFVYISCAGDIGVDRMELVQAVAEQLSMALHNIALQERLRVQSIRDPLTGLFNRRYLEESLVRELARCQRRGLPLALMMLDVDHFKAFNDQQGHPGGDALLAALGHVLGAQSRTEDIACRYGGEEFTLILPEATAEQAWARAQEVLAAVRAMRVEHLGHELPAVTASIGIAVAGQANERAEALLQRADRALYQAKRGGRDRVVSAAG